MQLRRILSMFLAGVMVLGLVACGNGNTNGTENSQSTENKGSTEQSESTQSSQNTQSGGNNEGVDGTESTEDTDATYVFSDEVWAFLSNADVKFVRQDENYVKVYDKKDLADGGTVIEIDPAKTYQSVEGFGASLTDSSAYVLSEMPEELIDEVMVNLFDKEKGIGLSTIRIPIGGCDFGFYNYTYDDMPKGEEDFELEHFDASEAEDQIALVKKAMAVNSDIKIFLSPWTAPTWMKTKGEFTSKDGGTLRRDCYNVYADYLVKSVQIYENENIPVYALSPQNEMFIIADWAGMYWDWEPMSAFVNDRLRPALEDAGLTTKILNMDHNWIYADKANQIMGATYNAADGVAYHWYNGTPEQMLTTKESFPDKEIWVTEATNVKPVGMSAFLKVSSMITRSLRSGANGYMLWNYALRHTGGPTVYENTGADSNAPILSVNLDKDEITYESDFYIMAHFSKYIHEGAVVVDSTDTGAENDYKLVNIVTVNPNGTMTAVLVNSGKEATTCKLVMGEQVMEVTVGAKSTVTLTWDANNY